MSSVQHKLTIRVPRHIIVEQVLKNQKSSNKKKRPPNEQTGRRTPVSTKRSKGGMTTRLQRDLPLTVIDLGKSREFVSNKSVIHTYINCNPADTTDTGFDLVKENSARRYCFLNITKRSKIEILQQIATKHLIGNCVQVIIALVGNTCCYGFKDEIGIVWLKGDSPPYGDVFAFEDNKIKGFF
jgi:hypothetical protein